MRQFSALVLDAHHVQRTTTVSARSADHAREQLLALGHQRVYWVI